MVLLNLIASLSLVAAVGVPAVVSSQSEIEESSESLIVRKNVRVVYDSSGSPAYCLDIAPLSDDVLFDGVLYFYDSSLLNGYAWTSPSGCSVYLGNVNYIEARFFFDVGLDTSVDYVNLYSVYIDGYSLTLYSASAGGILPIYPSLYQFVFRFDLADPNLSLIDWDNANVVFLKSTYAWADYEASHQIVPSISSGLGVVSNLASGLVGGFDSLALYDGALTNVMAFAFTLLGIGTAVGVAKLCFNWVTGRHGM